MQPGEFWRQLGDVTTKVSANAKELWLDPVKEIVRDIGGDVKEASARAARRTRTLPSAPPPRSAARERPQSRSVPRPPRPHPSSIAHTPAPHPPTPPTSTHTTTPRAPPEGSAAA